MLSQEWLIMTDARTMPKLVPFGKWRGYPVQYLACDPGWVSWAKNNRIEWVRKHYPDFAHILMNDARLASIGADGPAHNMLQAMFVNERGKTDSLYRRAFCQVAAPEWEKTLWTTFQSEVAYHSKGAQA
jgi:hypothetical protein